MIRNPLDRRMFVNPQQRRGMARSAQGILASGPRIMNAAMSQMGQTQAQRMEGLSDDSIITMPDIGPVIEDGIVTIPEIPVIVGTENEVGEDSGNPEFDTEIGTLDDVAPENQPAPIPSPPKPKPSKQEIQEIIEARDEANKPSSQQTMESIMNKISELRGTADKKKTKQQALKEAKDFLKEAGVDGVDDIRTSRDFMLMTLGLNIATGGSREGGLRGVLEDALTGSKETLGTYGTLKAAEAKDQRAMNLAAAEMAQAEIAAQRERGLKLDELEIEALTKQLEQQIKAEIGPDELQIA